MSQIFHLACVCCQKLRNLRHLVHPRALKPRKLRYLVHTRALEPRNLRHSVHPRALKPRKLRYLVHARALEPRNLRYFVHPKSANASISFVKINFSYHRQGAGGEFSPHFSRSSAKRTIHTTSAPVVKKSFGKPEIPAPAKNKFINQLNVLIRVRG